MSLFGKAKFTRLPDYVKPSFHGVTREFKIYEATVAKTSFKIASSSFSIYFAIMSVSLTFES